MLGIARLGDRTFGVCSCHNTPITVGGSIITGAFSTTVNGLPVARLGDTILADCGHTATIITSSVSTTVEGIGVARLGDQGTGCYVCSITTASPDTLTL